MARWLNGAAAGLAWAGLRHRPGRWLLLAVGIAVAACLPVVSQGLRAEASAAAVTAAVDGLAAPQRAVLAVTPRQLGPAELVEVDGLVRRGFAGAGLTSPRRLLTFRPLALGATDVTVGAADPLPTAVRLTAGRLPRDCRPTACEVVVVSAPGTGSRPDLARLARSARPLGLLVTGAAELTDQRPVGVQLVPPDLPLLLGGDPAAMARLTSLELFGRNTAWLASLDGRSIAAQGVPAFSRRVADISDQVNLASGQLSVAWPADVVSAAAARASASAQRFGVLGVGAGALQLGFCLVVAAAVRRRQQVTGQLLRRRGASAAQIGATKLIATTMAVAVGLLVGLGAGVLVVGLRGGSAVAEPWRAALAAATHSWPTVAALGVSAVVLTVVVVRWPEGLAGSTRLVLDAVLVALVGGAVLVSTTSAASSGAASVVVLVAAAAGLVAARLWPVVVRALSRGRLGPVRLVALVAGRRRPLLPSVTAGFLAAACSVLVFASCYRGSLLQSAADQAAAQVPLDVRVTPSAQSAAPWDVLDSPQLSAVRPPVARYPVISSAVTAFAGSSGAVGLPLTGIDPPLLPLMHQFGATTGSSLAPSELARRLAVPGSADGVPTDVSAGVRRLRFSVSGLTPDVTLSLWLGTRDGRERQVPLSGSASELSADVTGLGPATVRAVEIAESASHVTHRAHATGEGTTDRALPTGELLLGAVTADARPLRWSWRSWGSDQARLSASSAGSVRVRYQVSEVRVVLTPGFQQRAALAALPVAADPDTAARAGAGGAFGVTVNGVTVPAQLVAVLPRMPTLGPNFLLADRSAVTALLTRTAPGTATVAQVWIDVPADSLPRVREVFSSSTATTAAVSYRVDRYRAILADPVSTRFLLLVGAAGLTAFLLALLSLATAVRADLEQSAAEHFALELDGVPTSRLRRVLLGRWLTTLAVGVPVGVVGGAVLAVAAVRMLIAGPDGTPVVPPLRVWAGTSTTVAVIAAALVSGALVCALVARSAFRQPAPRPGEDDLR